MALRVFLVAAVSFAFFQPLAAQQSAWELLLTQNPEAADDRSIGWQDRLILHALTPTQAQRYFSSQVAAEDLILESGQTLARFLEEKLNPSAHVYVPLATPCSLFELEGSVGEVWRLQTQGDLTMQGGSASGCAIPDEASTLLLQIHVESLGHFPARVKLWSPEEPEPAETLAGRPALDFPLSYQMTLVVSACAEGDCFPGEFDLKISESAAIGGRAVGYFRPLLASDQPGGVISLATEGDSNNFFGTGAGANNTGSFNSFFGGNAGNANTSGNSNSFFGQDAGSSNTSGFNNSFFGQDAGESNSTGINNSFFGENAGANNTTGARNSFFGKEAGLSNSTGFDNSFFGENAGANNTAGAGNSFFGSSAGQSNTTEDNNTFVGVLSDGTTAINNATAVGYRTQVSQSNSLVLGSISGLNGATTSVRVGIGTDMPAAPLHVQRADGTIQIIRAQSTGPEAIRNMMDLINNGIPQFRLVDTSADGNNWQFSNTNSGLNISLQGSGSQEFLIEDDGDVFINNGTVQVTSSRETKRDFAEVNPGEILSRLVELDVLEWRYKKDPETVRHIGPVSEDFHRLFGVGDGDKHVTPTDLSGVALAAIQGLLEQNRRLSKRVSELSRQIGELQKNH